MLSRLVLAAVIRTIWSPSCFERGATSGPALGAWRLQAILALPSAASLFFGARGEFILPFQVFAGSARNQPTAIRAKWCSVVAAPQFRQRFAAPGAVRTLAFLADPLVQHLLWLLFGEVLSVLVLFARAACRVNCNFEGREN